MNVLSAVAILLVAATLALGWWRRVSALISIIVANILVFVLAMATGAGLSGLTPWYIDDLATRITYLTDGPQYKVYTMVTATFLHRDVMHLASNVLVLALMGLHFEERVGRGRFLAIYFSSGVVAVLLHGAYTAATGGDISIPLVGASGAVFGILGAFAALYPRDQVPMWLVFVILPRVPVWIAAVVLSAVEAFALLGSSMDGVARAAHLGGVVGGVLFGFLLRPPERKRSGAKVAPVRLDYGVLDRLATDSQQRSLVEKVKANADETEIQRAWLERLFRSVQCPSCGSRYIHERGGAIICERGHQERYVA